MFHLTRLPSLSRDSPKIGNAPDGAKWLDLLMLVIAGGRERTAEQWRVLLGDAGWRATRVGEGVIEAEPA